MASEQLAKLFIQLGVFGLVLALWLGGVTFWMLRRSQRQKKLERRLQFAQEGVDEERIIRLWHEGKAVEAFVPDSTHMSWGERLERMRQDAGWSMGIPTVILLLLTTTAAAGAMVWTVTGKWLVGVAGTLPLLLFFRTY